MLSIWRRVAMAEKEQENALGGWLVKAATALVPSAIAAVLVAWGTIQIVKAEVDKLVASDREQNKQLVRHTAELATLNERMVQSIEALRTLMSMQQERFRDLEGRVINHQELDARDRSNGSRR